MVNLFRKDSPRKDLPQEEAPRWTVGLYLGPDCRSVKASLVCMRGRHVGSPLEIRQTRIESVPDEVVALYHQLTDPNMKRTLSGHFRELAELRDMLAELQSACVIDLVTQARLAPSEVSAVGAMDPGLWSFDESDEDDASRYQNAGSHAPSVAYLPLTDATMLAERTGMNIIGSFPCRDIAQGGRGGPLLPLAEWILLKSNTKNRLLIDFGPTIRATFLPKASSGNPRGRIVSTDIAPGTRLLSALLLRLPQLEHAIALESLSKWFGEEDARVLDPSDALIGQWIASRWVNRPVPNWRPDGIPIDPFLEDLDTAVGPDQLSRGENALLPTAICFQLEAVARHMKQTLAVGGESEQPELCELIVKGDSRYADGFAGLLDRHLNSMSTGLLKVNRLALDDDFKIPPDSLEATCVALITLLHLDQVPANLPLVTGAEIARVLGELTPGSPQSWHKLLKELTGAVPTIRPLRSAL